MTHWTYRVVRTDYDGEHSYTIREIYYRGDGTTAHSYPVHPYGDTRAELRADLERMLAALDHPTLIDREDAQ